MIKSMTGYGRAEDIIDGRGITVEVKSVNHRFFEVNCRSTRGYGFLDDRLKKFLQGKIFRGKVDVYVSVETLEDADAEVRVNHSLAAGYVAALRQLQERYALGKEIGIDTLARYSDIFSVHRAPEDEELIWRSVQTVASAAVEQLLAMRTAEGTRLKEDMQARAAEILALVEQIERRSPQTVADYQARLQVRMKELLGEVHVDDQRLLTETAIFADKVAVAEETVRLRSHFLQMETMLCSREPVGRKLDFLVQEMNREANTIGSKALDAEIAHMVVDIKAEIEKIREQVQNVE
jgi:uncharacterized protein (TIGR00255 family)